MHSFFQDYLQRLIDLHQDLLNAIEGMTSEALDWTPIQKSAGEMNAINVLVTHLCGAERYWIGDIACGDNSDRKRAEEFNVSGLDAANLTTKINNATQYAQSALEGLSIDDLPAEKSQLRDGRAVTVAWALLHALEHTATHLGHIQITRQMWDKK